MNRITSGGDASSGDASYDANNGDAIRDDDRRRRRDAQPQQTPVSQRTRPPPPELPKVPGQPKVSS
jgi:hypothetical protein